MKLGNERIMRRHNRNLRKMASKQMEDEGEKENVPVRLQ